MSYREYLIAHIMVTTSAQSSIPEIAAKRAIAYADAIINELEREEYEYQMSTPDNTQW